MQLELMSDGSRRWAATRGVQSVLLVLLLAACQTTTTGGDQAPAQCSQTCDSEDAQCGTVCGQDCGSCQPDGEGHALACSRGRCVCVPQCQAGTCGQDDGCGYQCPCATDISCETCGLRLVKKSQRTQAGHVEQVTLQLESTAAAGAALPRVADIRIASDRPMELERVQAGAAVGGARKLLHRFTGTNLPFHKEEDGSWRILVLAGARNAEIPAGAWLTLTFKSPAGDTHTGPVAFRLVRSPDVVAPASANTLLQSTPYDAPLAVGPTRW